MKKRAIFAALCVLVSGQVSRANPPVDPLLIQLNQQRKVALPVWNSIARTNMLHSFDVPYSSDEMPSAHVLLADAVMHDTIAPKRLADARAEAARQPPQEYGLKDDEFVFIAILQKVTGDAVGFRKTRAMIDITHVTDKTRKILDDNRLTLLQSMPEPFICLGTDKIPKSDIPTFSGDGDGYLPMPSEGLKPFISFYYRILQLAKKNKGSQTAEVQKIIRQAKKQAQAYDSGENYYSNDALELIASAQARLGDFAGARKTVHKTVHRSNEAIYGDDTYFEGRTLLHITQIQIDQHDLAGAEQTLSKVPPSNDFKVNVIEELALAQMRAGKGEAALQTLDTISEPERRCMSKCVCVSIFLTAPYVAYTTHDVLRNQRKVVM